MQISLPPQLQRFVEGKVQSGQYADANQVVVEALEVLYEQETLTPEHEEYLRQEIARGIEQANRGEYADFDAESIIAEQRRQSHPSRESR